jgi:hypothetical protein
LFAGATNATDAEPLPCVATTAVGGPGSVATRKLLDTAEGPLGPKAFVAVAVQLYTLPFVRPVTTIGLPAPDAEPVAPPSDDGHVTR